MMISHKKLNIYAFSDTHGKHEKVQIPASTDVLICAGDVEADKCDLIQFMKWYSAIPAQLRLFVPGNHDLSFDMNPTGAVREWIPNNVKLLLNSGILYKGFSFYSIEVRPYMHAPMSIPDNLDVLITHGAAKNHLDNGYGCPLLAKILSNHPPQIHLFGHIHECGNQKIDSHCTTFYNVSLYKEL